VSPSCQLCVSLRASVQAHINALCWSRTWLPPLHKRRTHKTNGGDKASRRGRAAESPSCAQYNTAQCCVIYFVRKAEGLRCMVPEHSSSLGQVCPVAFAAHLLVITATAICELCCRCAEVGRVAGTCERACETLPHLCSAHNANCTTLRVQQAHSIDTIEWQHTTSTSAFCAHLARAASSCSDRAER
jgi:hypothetical protein